MSDRRSPSAPSSPESWVGVGLRHPHYGAFVDGAPPVAWLEVHPENYFCGGARRRVLAQVAERWPISLHGVGLSLGSPEGLDADHLARFARLAAETRPVRVSEHLAWSRNGGIYFNDLLPLPLTEESFAVVLDNVRRAQDALKQPLLIENPSVYVDWTCSTMGEAAFLTRLCDAAGCGLLLDVNNVYVSAINLGHDPAAALAAFPAERVAQYHLAGHAVRQRDDGRPLLIDDHGSPTVPAVWDLFDQALARIGPRPTLIEWDSAIPPLDALLAEADEATAAIARALARRTETEAPHVS